MKICFISHSSDKFGAERALLELIDALKGKIESYVILPRSGPLVEEFKKRNITYCVLPYRWWVGKKFPIWKRIARIILNLFTWIPITIRIKGWKCNIVYTNTISVCVGALAAKLLGLPHVWHIHEFGYEGHRLVFDFGEKFSLWFMNRFSDAIIINSYAVAKKYQKYFPLSKIKVIYQAVNVPQEINESEVHIQKNDKFYCAIAGSLQEGKRQEEAILAINELVRRGINVELLIIGKGELKYKKYLKDLVAKNHLTNYVRFLGYIDNPFPYIKAVDVILVCSRYEAFGRVTIEAMKLGKPVIGAKSGGTLELIQEGFNGFLYTPGNYKELAEKITFLYEHPEIARQIGENAKRWANQHFTQEKYGNEVFKILNDLYQ
jgi:glycosyltransferase involved in cell wall biosynthesis